MSSILNFVNVQNHLQLIKFIPIFTLVQDNTFAVAKEMSLQAILMMY